MFWSVVVKWMRLLVPTAVVCVQGCGNLSPSGQEEGVSYLDAHLTLIDFELGATARGFFSDQIVVTGRLRNRGEISVEEAFTMTVLLLGQDGRTIDSGSRLFTGIDSGQTRSFQLICKGVYARADVITVADLPLQERPIDAALTDTVAAGAVAVPIDQVVDWTVIYEQ